MKPLQSAGLLATALAAPWLASADEPKRPAPPAAADAQDLVFLGDKRPVLLRLHVHLDGRPIQAAWRDYVRKWFDYLDRDGKGYLTRVQVQYAPRAQAFQALRQQGFFFANPGSTIVAADLRKKAADDKIVLDDLVAYYARFGAGPVQVTAPNGNNIYRRVSEALFAHLDVNQDGKLSPEELFAGEKLLRKLDANDDEMLSPQELLPATGVPVAFTSGVRIGAPGPGPVAASSGFYVIPPDGNAAPLAALLLAHYDKDKNTRLSRAEIGLDRTTFEQLDVNKDGELDVEELARWHKRPADLELVVRIGKTADGEATVDTFQPGGRRARLAGRVNKPADGVLLLTLGDAQVNVQRSAFPTFRGGFNFQQFILQQFQAVDVKGRGYIEREDLKNNGQAQFLRQVFALVDRDGDGRMTENELRAFLDLQAGAASSFVALEILEKGRGLFEILDANRDGLLSVRELRTGWQRLAPLDKEGAGFIRMTDVPRQFQLTVGGGQGAVRVAGGGALPGFGSGGRAAPAKGPLWFRKMDRNGDGDVSRREFLGSRADFDRIDTDGDGLIDAAEAQRADAWFRDKLRRRK
jgi:Ca2+-binding EF-hand superfamily protein